MATNRVPPSPPGSRGFKKVSLPSKAQQIHPTACPTENITPPSALLFPTTAAEPVSCFLMGLACIMERGSPAPP